MNQVARIIAFFCKTAVNASRGKVEVPFFAPCCRIVVLGDVDDAGSDGFGAGGAMFSPSWSHDAVLE